MVQFTCQVTGHVQVSLTHPGRKEKPIHATNVGQLILTPILSMRHTCLKKSHPGMPADHVHGYPDDMLNSPLQETLSDRLPLAALTYSCRPCSTAADGSSCWGSTAD